MAPTTTNSKGKKKRPTKRAAPDIRPVATRSNKRAALAIAAAAETAKSSDRASPSGVGPATTRRATVVRAHNRRAPTAAAAEPNGEVDGVVACTRRQWDWARLATSRTQETTTATQVTPKKKKRASVASIDPSPGADEVEAAAFAHVASLHEVAYVGKPPRVERTTIRHKGHKYTRAGPGMAKTTLYRCSYRRRKNNKFKGAMVFRVATMDYKIKAAHTCQDGETNTTLRDITVPMKAMVDSLALTDLSLVASEIWAKVSAAFYRDDDNDVIKGLSEEQVEDRVFNIRRKHFGSNIHGVIEVGPLSFVHKTRRRFFRFHNIKGQDDDSPPRRIIGWADPELMEILYDKNVSLSIDGTFRCVPRGFAQCIVIMAHEHRSGLCVPVYYILTTDRTEGTYFDLLHSVIESTNEKLKPGDVTCDFEQGLVNAVSIQFPETIPVGCLFHFKQAVRRRMKKIGISNLQASIAMQNGYLDMLTVIDRSKIVSHGIPWVCSKIRKACRRFKTTYARDRWGVFWQYFRHTWIKRFPPMLWNVHGVAPYLVVRTNNPLERFNRELNSAVPAHPSLPLFVTTISKISARYAERLNNVRKKRSKKKTREPIMFRLPTAVEFGDGPFKDSDDEVSSGDGDCVDDAVNAFCSNDSSNGDSSDNGYGNALENGNRSYSATGGVESDGSQSSAEVEMSYSYKGSSSSSESHDYAGGCANDGFDSDGSI